MSRLLVLANLELSFDCPDGVIDSDEYVRRKERRLLRMLRQLASEDPEVSGNLERLELESFSYSSGLEAEPTGYYYNKHEAEEAGTN